MTDVNSPAGSSNEEPAAAEGPIIRDKRRLDPETGQVRNTQTAEGSSPVTQDSSETPGADSAFGGAVGDDLPGKAGADAASATAGSSTQVPEVPSAQGAGEQPDEGHLQDELLRERAAFHNYRELMKRERPKDREQAIGMVVESLLPVLDDIYLAEQHGDLAGSPFEKIAAKLETTLGKHGVARFGAVGEPFDPAQHEALMHIEAQVPEGSEGTTVVQVMQPGFKVGERVVRPARVAVADPQ